MTGNIEFFIYFKNKYYIENVQMSLYTYSIMSIYHVTD